MSRILIVEDDEDLKEGLEFSLKMEGYEIQSVSTKNCCMMSNISFRY